jgi:lipopolysaccharide heptosyltransferase II
MPGTLTKTLIIRFSSVGDIVLSTPLIRSLRRQMPQGQIDYLVRADYADLLRGNPSLSRVIEYPREGTLADVQRLRTTIDATGYDCILDIHGSLRSRLLCRGLRNVVRIHKRVIPRFLLVHFKKDLYTFFGGSPPVTERYFEPLIPWNITDNGEGTELFPSPEARARADAVLLPLRERKLGDLIGVCPSARHCTKMWPAERFAESAATLGAQYSAGIVLFGSSNERDRCTAIASQMTSLAPGVPVLNAAGMLSLSETAAAMDHCRIILTNDSGLMHIAAARKRKLVAIFGSTAQQFGFYPPADGGIVIEEHELECRPCTPIGRASCPRGHLRCLLDIPSARVVSAASVLMNA